MYKIYINETPLILTRSDKLEKIKGRVANELIVTYMGKSKFLLNYIDMLEKSVRFDRVIIHSNDYEKLRDDFFGLFNLVKASGGVVTNSKDQALLIFRRNVWDLPKGKIEAGEKKKKAAIREVMEETGIKDVKLLKRIGVTYHTYKTITRARTLKKTYWYHMKSNETKFSPQKSEKIEKVEWKDISSFLASGLPTYGNIIDILKRYLDKKSKAIAANQ